MATEPSPSTVNPTQTLVLETVEDIRNRRHEVLSHYDGSKEETIQKRHRLEDELRFTVDPGTAGATPSPLEFSSSDAPRDVLKHGRCWSRFGACLEHATQIRRLQKEWSRQEQRVVDMQRLAGRLIDQVAHPDKDRIDERRRTLRERLNRVRELPVRKQDKLLGAHEIQLFNRLLKANEVCQRVL